MATKSMAVPAVAGVGMIGALAYYSSRPPKPEIEQRRDRVQSKRDNGLGGAGVGGNLVTGGPEPGQVGSGTPPKTHDPARKIDTDAPPEKLPAGGAGGGVGAGGANARAVEKDHDRRRGDNPQHAKEGSSPSSAGGGDGDSSASSWQQPSGQGPTGLSERFTALFGQGGKAASDDSKEHAAHHNTVVASNHAYTPSKATRGRDQRPAAKDGE
ncbi:hypothetical protein B0I35DRAFT_427927 [Stachybotrys elegans]|uniref:Uncharacterized protein n=1 Tax=Stachybotrys elegans TaxID=80388 RepID=A0A8K0WSI3_9HYPO|nr:hypothetical protein B0I35DRAFT_427927 [Stachybotrys elegans]